MILICKSAATVSTEIDIGVLRSCFQPLWLLSAAFLLFWNVRTIHTLRANLAPGAQHVAVTTT
mgnify:CR=1 FL=1